MRDARSFQRLGQLAFDRLDLGQQLGGTFAFRVAKTTELDRVEAPLELVEQDEEPELVIEQPLLLRLDIHAPSVTTAAGKLKAPLESLSTRPRSHALCGAQSSRAASRARRSDEPIG